MFKRYFDNANIVFWILIIILVIMFFPFTKEEIFDGSKFLVKKERIKEEDNLKRDSSSNSKDEKPEEEKEVIRNYKKINWEWVDPYSSKKGKIAIDVLEDDYDKAVKNRQWAIFGGLNYVYPKLINNDVTVLKKMAEEFKRLSKEYHFDYVQTLKFVLGSIQSIPYTLVLSSSFSRKCPCMSHGNEFLDDCSVRKDGKGCCNDINNYGLFTPVEFAVRKTGDCDTRTVFAYTILSQMGYDVTILNNDEHSIFGVSTPSVLGAGNSVRGNNGKIYYAVELTAIVEPGIRLNKLNTFRSVIK